MAWLAWWAEAQEVMAGQFAERPLRVTLGHANIGITLDTYSHVTAGLHKEAAEEGAALFRSPVSDPLTEGQ